MIPPLPDFARVLAARLASPVPFAFRPDPTAVGRRMLGALSSTSGARAAISASTIGRCSRQLAYRVAGFPAEDRPDTVGLSWAGYLGDQIEVRVFAALADALLQRGPWTTPDLEGWSLSEGQHVVARCGAFEIPGTTDGVFAFDGQPAAVLEVKGVGAGGFADVRPGPRRAGGWDSTDVSGYWWQHQAYLHGAGLDRGYMIAVSRGIDGHCGWATERDPGFADSVVAHLTRVAANGAVPVAAWPDGRPVEPDAKTGRLLPCERCDYRRRCWGERIKETRAYGGRVEVRLREAA